MMTVVQPVPTNIITGFLGVGKTSAILNFLKSKPPTERWAVLVNEFGEIGVDGSLFKGQHSEEEGVFVHEVPGGCMCCTAGLPMQIALNQLLVRAKPDRLLIEPTGLGHPKEVLQLLSSKHYRNVLSLQKTLTLVDARKLIQKRYTTHNTFNQQIEMADRVIGNKLDLYQPQDITNLIRYVGQHGQSNAEVSFSEQGKVDLSHLEGDTFFRCSEKEFYDNANIEQPSDFRVPIPDCGYVKAINEGDGFISAGWRFEPEIIFEHRKLISLLTGIKAERLKGVMITDQGIFGYNLTQDALTEVLINDCMESSIEIISDELINSFESQLMNCVITHKKEEQIGSNF